jgi:hypothetical protein
MRIQKMAYRITQAATELAVEKKLAAYLKRCRDNHLTPSAAVAEFESHLDDDADNGDTNESEYALCGFKMTYRVTGRATQAEERCLRNLDRNDSDNGDRVVSKDYCDWKKRFDEDGWSAFDKEETILFNELTAEFGGATIDKAGSGAFQESTFHEGPVSQAKRDKALRVIKLTKLGRPITPSSRQKQPHGEGSLDPAESSPNNS